MIEIHFVVLKTKLKNHITAVLNDGYLFKNTFRTFKIYSVVSLTGGATAEYIFCDCRRTIQHIFLECSDTLPVRNSSFGNALTLQNFMTIV